MVNCHVVCDPSVVERIDAALAAREAGDPAMFNGLVLSLSPETNPEETADILIGLTHFSTALNDPDITSSRHDSLQEIFDAAINLEFSKCLRPHGMDGSSDSRARPHRTALSNKVGEDGSTSHPFSTVSTTTSCHPSRTKRESSQDLGRTPVPRRLLDGYKEFVRNAASAGSGYVEQLMTTFARHHCKLPFPQFEGLVDVVHDTLVAAIRAYPSAESVFARVIGENYPHVVRPLEEHLCYSRAVLRVVSLTESTRLARVLVSTVIERLATIDAMVPDELGEFKEHKRSSDPTEKSCSNRGDSDSASCQLPSAASEGMPQACSSSPLSSVGESSSEKCEVRGQFVLDPVAEKMDALLHEVLLFLRDLSFSQACADIFPTISTAVLRSVENCVVASEAGKHTALILLYATSLLGSDSVVATADLFRVLFFDPESSNRVRIAYLFHSAALLCRARCVAAPDVRKWLNHISAWLNSYIDRVDDLNCAVDAQEHEMFYAGVYAFLYTICTRSDVFDISEGGAIEAAHELRVLRVLSTELSPLLVFPPDVVAHFCATLSSVGDIDLSDLFEHIEGKRVSAWTKSGSLNRFRATMPMEVCGLPKSRSLVWQHYRPPRIFDVLRSRKRARPSIGRRKSTCGHVDHDTFLKRDTKRRRVSQCP